MSWRPSWSQSHVSQWAPNIHIELIHDFIFRGITGDVPNIVQSVRGDEGQQWRFPRTGPWICSSQVVQINTHSRLQCFVKQAKNLLFNHYSICFQGTFRIANIKRCHPIQHWLVSLQFFKTNKRSDESQQEIHVYRQCPGFYQWNHKREPRFHFIRVWQWWDISSEAHRSLDRKPNQCPDRHPPRYNLDIIWGYFGTNCQFKITPQPGEKCIIPQDHQSRGSSDEGGNLTDGLWFQEQVSLVHRNSVKPNGFLVEEVAKEIGGHEDTN